MYAYSNIEYEIQAIDEFIEREMHDTRKQAMKKLSSIVVHSLEEIARILSYAYFDNLDSANKLSDDLDLCKLDFLAINEDFNEFKKEYLKYEDL